MLVPTVVGLGLLTTLALRVRLLFAYNADNNDEGVYWASLRSISRGHALFAEVFSSQPPLFLLGLLPAFEAFGHTLVAARVMIFIYSFVALVGIYWTARSLAGRRAGWIAVLLLASYPLFANQSVVLGAEMPAIALELTSLAFAVSAAKATGRRRLLLAALSGAALAVGVLNKLPVVLGAIPSLAYLLGWSPQADGERITWRSITNSLRTGTLVTFVAGTCAAMLVALAPFWERRSLLYEQVIGFHAAAEGHVRLLGNLRKLLGPIKSIQPFFGLFVIVCLVLLVRRRHQVVVPPLLWALATFASLLVHHPLFPHHVLLLAPPLVLIVALAVPPPTDATGRAEGARWAQPFTAATVIFIIVGTVISTYAAGTHGFGIVTTPGEIAMVDGVRAVTKPGDYVVSDTQYLVALADRDVPPPLVDTSHVRIAARSLTEPQLRLLIVRYRVRAVLFTGKRFEFLPQSMQFQRWVRAHFHSYRRFGHSQVLYFR